MTSTTRNNSQHSDVMLFDGGISLQSRYIYMILLFLRASYDKNT